MRSSGRQCFQNEIIWSYDYGARATKRWPAKHDNILWYTKDAKQYTFNLNDTDRIVYMSPALVGAEKAARGKTPTDVWWHTIVSPTGKEKTGYPTQKPLGMIERIVRVHSNSGEMVLDFFAGSGTTGEAAANNGRSFIMVDESAVAVAVMEKRLKIKAQTILDSQSEVVHRAEDKERAQRISQTSSEGYTSTPEGAPVGSEAICGANRKSSGEAHRTPVEW